MVEGALTGRQPPLVAPGPWSPGANSAAARAAVAPVTQVQLSALGLLDLSALTMHAWPRTTRGCRVVRVMNPTCEKERKNLPNQNETSRRSITAMAAVDALQHVTSPWLRPSSKIRGTRIALASCHA
jgi:hypothetical protein